MTTSAYRGRFAPSPTGPLHFGSILTAVASYLEARTHHGKWLIRIDDLDTPRCVEGMDSLILNTLEQFGMYWDEEVAYQSRNNTAYEQALTILEANNNAYPCGCTRKEIADIAKTGSEGPVYPGTCRNGLAAGKQARSTRFISPDRHIQVADAIQHNMSQNPAAEIGDFIIKRADGLFAYQLAVVVDDELQNISHVVRGSDLMMSTPRQVSLQQALGYKTPAYAHIPVATNDQGRKLSKQSFAKAVKPEQAVPTLVKALQFLQQDVEQGIEKAGIDDFWQSAMQYWKLENVPGVMHITLENHEFY